MDNVCASLMPCACEKTYGLRRVESFYLNMAGVMSGINCLPPNKRAPFPLPNTLPASKQGGGIWGPTRNNCKTKGTKLRLHHDPVVRLLIAQDYLKPADIDYVIEHGQWFLGKHLPDGIKRSKPGTCHERARELAEAGIGKYVRGFCIQDGGSTIYEHSWVTKDKRFAIEPIWRNPRDYHYWGLIGLDHEPRLRRMDRSKIRFTPPMPRLDLNWILGRW